MKQFVVLPVFFLLSVAGMAQQKGEQDKGKITGRVLDGITKKGVEYATITVYQPGNTKPVNGTMTNDKGVFAVSGMTVGRYSVVVEFIGHESRYIDSVVIGAKTLQASVGDVLLMKKDQELQGVTVTAQRGLVENKIDKMVYNAEKDITSQGGVATDVLKKVPMVSVDVDGNVELQGNGNIRFLINGKPSSIFGNNITDALQSIPAGQIKSIEVITSPGAKYDAEGTGGIINIILKDSRVRGVNGNINLSGGSRLENGSLNLNARKDNFGVNAFFSGNAQRTSTTVNGLDRTSFDSTGAMSGHLLQNGQSAFSRNGFESGLGFDWIIDKRSNLSGNIGLDNFGNNSNSFNNQRQTQYGSGTVLSDIYSIIHSTNHFRGQSTDWSLNYKKTFSREDQELNISYQNSYGNNRSSYSQYQNPLQGDSILGGSNSSSIGKDNEMSLQADYTQPLSDKVKLESGLKTDIRKISSNTDVFSYNGGTGSYEYDKTQSNQLIYNRNVYAAYTSLAFPIGSFLDAKAGLRYERTQTSADFSKAAVTSIPDYNTWAPALVISHSFSNEESIKISYSHRIQRPGYRALNPYVNASDPKNLSTGNPYLLPEVANNIELGYMKSFDKGGSFNVALFYHRSAQDIQPYIVYHPSYKVGDSVYTNVSVTSSENIGVENNLGLNLYGSVPLTSKLNVRTNLSFFDRYIENGITTGTINSFNYRANMNITYQFNNNFIGEAFGNFNSARNEVQGKYPSFSSYSFAFRKQLWHKKGSVGFTTTNPFNKYVNQPTEVTGQGFTLNSTRKVPYQSFGISFTLKFGRLEFKKEPEQPHTDEGNPDRAG
ncbi:MAG TPA: TonB-dependent receptor [Chitinophagaceae bacterium]